MKGVLRGEADAIRRHACIIGRHPDEALGQGGGGRVPSRCKDLADEGGGEERGAGFSE